MASLKVLVVWSLLYFMSQKFYCQTQEYPYVSFNGMVLANHSYVNLLLVINTESGIVFMQCHTNLQTCCRYEQGKHRGDWFFPNGSVLGFSSNYDVNDDIVEYRGTQRVDLRCTNMVELLVYIIVLLQHLLFMMIIYQMEIMCMLDSEVK